MSKIVNVSPEARARMLADPTGGRHLIDAEDAESPADVVGPVDAAVAPAATVSGRRSRARGVRAGPAANGGGSIERRLWATADELRANSKLKSSEYSVPVLGLIFLRYADVKFARAEQELAASGGTGRRRIGKTDYQARGVMYLPEAARFSGLLELTEGENIGRAINDAMRAIEEENEELRGILPKSYTGLENRTLVELLKLLQSVPADVEGVSVQPHQGGWLGAGRFCKLAA